MNTHTLALNRKSTQLRDKEGIVLTLIRLRVASASVSNSAGRAVSPVTVRFNVFKNSKGDLSFSPALTRR